MSPSPPASPRRVALPRYMQTGSGAGSPPLQPLLPPPAPASPAGALSPDHSGSSASWQFGTLSVPFSSRAGGTEGEEVGVGGASLVGDPSSLPALRAELAALRSAFGRIEATNAGLREQVRSLEQLRQRVQTQRVNLVGRLRDAERELAGARQEVGNLKDALSITEDERDDLRRRLHEVERELHRVQQRVLELRIASEGRTFERRAERDGRLSAVQDVSRLREELELVRREASADRRRLSGQVHALLEELDKRVPRALYDCVVERARENDRRARGEEVVVEDEAGDLQGDEPMSGVQESGVGSGDEEE
ncbi:hypothetical protein GGF50DRAFT_121220 [Schizophyllum commune]